MHTVGITGGTGFLGRHLRQWLLNRGYQVVVFTRNPHHNAATGGVHYAYWDPEKGQCEQGALKDLTAVVHLAGAGVADKRWTQARKKEIVESRVLGTRFLVEQIRQAAPACKTFIAASATGYYGPDRHPAEPFAEDMPHYPDFLGATCYKWEQESRAISTRCRTVILRIGIVLGREGGAFPQLYRPLRMGIKPILGPGTQMVSWIHVNDLVAMIGHALEEESIAGTYNAVSGQPVTHRTLMDTLARVKGGPALTLPVPAVLLKLALGELSTELLKSTTVSNEKIVATGFHYQYPQLEGALRKIVGRGKL